MRRSRGNNRPARRRADTGGLACNSPENRISLPPSRIGTGLSSVRFAVVHRPLSNVRRVVVREARITDVREALVGRGPRAQGNRNISDARDPRKPAAKFLQRGRHRVRMGGLRGSLRPDRGGGRHVLLHVVAKQLAEGAPFASDSDSKSRPSASSCRTIAPTTSCACRNGMPRDDQVVGDVGGEQQPAAARAGALRMQRQLPITAAVAERDAASVSSASKSGSLSSCRSLL